MPVDLVEGLSDREPALALKLAFGLVLPAGCTSCAHLAHRASPKEQGNARAHPDLLIKNSSLLGAVGLLGFGVKFALQALAGLGN